MIKKCYKKIMKYEIKLKVELKKINSEPVYNDKFIKTKVNLYNTPFLFKKIPKEVECYTCLSIILLDSIINVDNKYYTQVFL